MVDVFFCALWCLGKLYCKFVNACLHVGGSIVYASIFKVGCSRHFSLTLAIQHFALFLYRFTVEKKDSSSAEKDYLGDRPVAGTSQSEFNRNPTTVESSRRSNQTRSRTAESPIVQDVFNTFKSYLEVKLEKKGKQIERNQRLTSKSVHCDSRETKGSLITTPSSILSLAELEQSRMVTTLL